jgi:CelD/BcsL family acetyltransferase involved in cellulose biosynthesis
VSVSSRWVASAPVRRLTAAEDLAQAYAAWMATADRRGFTDVRPWPGLEPVLRHCIDQGLGSVLGTFAEQRLVAAAFITHIGKTAAYVYGGYKDGAEKLSPTHVLQYEAIQASIEKGMSAYNFGYLISEGQAEGKGVDEFKLGFGAVPQRHLDTIIWKRKPILYSAFERLRHGSLGQSLEAFLRNRVIRRGNH